MKWFFAVSLSLFSTAALAADKPVLASGKLVLPKNLAEKAKGIRTVFISIVDAKSGPMPWGAQKLSLEKDAEGNFLTFTLTPENVTAMGGGTPPEVMNLKAKLDKDGSAGMDASGDIVGTAKNVKKGTENLTITLEKAVP